MASSLSAKERQHKKEREMAIQRFDRKNVEEVLDACKEALELVAEEYGVLLQRKHCTYQYNEVPIAFKLIIPERAEDGEAIDPKETEFRKYAGRFGLDPNFYGETFKTYSGSFEVCGIKPKSRKYPVLGKNLINGKVFKFQAQVVLDGIGQKGGA